jgi:hypothetical protein
MILVAVPAQAAVLRVPQQYASIDLAIAAANPHDTIRVGRGRYCGVAVTKPVHLVGEHHPIIAGCATSPTLDGVLRVGLLLDGAGGASPASGTTIRGFVFDGAGVSNTNTEPLAFGVFARFASEVVVEDNRFEGTVQAITNGAGDRWIIRANRIHDLTLFDCTGFCGGGDAIVVQLARPPFDLPGGAGNPANRPKKNLVSFNEVSGHLPDHFDSFSMVGILALAADETVVFGNRVSMFPNPSGAAKGEAIVLTNSCCGEQQHFTPGTRAAVVIGNDGDDSDYVMVVEGGPGENTDDLLAFLNEGKVLREDLGQTAARVTRTLVTPIHAPF